MKKLSALVVIVGVVQIVLGVMYLFQPELLLAQMGHSAVAPDIAYPLAMLAARFLVYGALLLWAVRRLHQHHLLVSGMMWIQIVDLAAGLYHTLNGTVSLTLSGFPMFNAALFAALLWCWKRPLATGSGAA